MSTSAGAGLIQHDVVTPSLTTRLIWDYESSSPRIRSLYERSVEQQWHASDVDWTTGVDPERFSLATASIWHDGAPRDFPLPTERQDAFAWHYHVWQTSQFLHGEQAALACAARLVEVMPTLDDKLMAAMQTVDEARHVDVYRRYVVDHLRDHCAIDPALETLLTEIISDWRWDVVCLGMQIIVEGLALAAFRLSSYGDAGSLIADITARVSRDESRHVSYGMLALSGFYSELTAPERRDREQLVLEAARLMALRFELAPVWDRVDVPVAEGRAFVQHDRAMHGFRQVLFSRVVSGVGRLGLLSTDVIEGLTKLGLRPGSMPRGGLS